MMIEALFQRDGQTEAFLWMLLCGVVLGLMTHAGSLVRKPFVKALWDVLTALLFGGMVLWITGVCGAPIRAYALLGIVLGLLLYAAGAGRLVTRLSKTFRPKEGEAASCDEMNKEVP